MRFLRKQILYLSVFAMAVMLCACGKSGFRAKRNITVVELNGGTKVTSENAGEAIAYQGMQLVSGDFVDVAYDSDLTMQLDEDKHLYAGSNTRFTVEATGKRGKTKTVVALDEGSTLIGIENKLGSKESFEVTTPNSTISVRGTTFKVKVEFDEAGVPTTTVEVIKGEVEVKTSSDGIEQSYSVTEGKYISLHGKDGDVGIISSGDAADLADKAVSNNSSEVSSDDEWAEYYANPKEGYFFVTGTAYPFFDYYSDMLAEKSKQYDEIGGAGMVVVFDEPQNYKGEMIDRCCFVFCAAEMPPEEEWNGVHMEFYGYWNEDYEEQPRYDMTMEAVGNLHTFYAYRYRSIGAVTTSEGKDIKKSSTGIDVPQEYLNLTADLDKDVIMPVTDTYIVEVIKSHTDRYGDGQDVYMLSFDENGKDIMGGRAHSGSSEWASVLYKKHSEYADNYEDFYRTGNTVYIKYIPDKVNKGSNSVDTSNYTLKQWYEAYEQNSDPEDEIVYLYCSKPLE
jgi:hypothetical protein